MYFQKKAYFEASAQSDGVTISVNEFAHYTSEISYQDACQKANELAKLKAYAKLEETLDKLHKKQDSTIIKSFRSIKPERYFTCCWFRRRSKSDLLGEDEYENHGII